MPQPRASPGRDSCTGLAAGRRLVHIAAMRLPQLAALAFTLTLAVGPLGCATTTVEHVWRAPDWNGSFTHIAIFGMSPMPGVRRDFESKMVAAFADVGVRATASYQLFANEGELHDQDIARVLTEHGIDGALVARLVGVDKEYRSIDGSPYYGVIGGTRDGFYRYYHDTYAVLYSPEYLVDYDIVVVETNLYQVANSELVWAGLSETFDPKDVDEAIESYGQTMVKTLVLGGLLTRTITPGTVEMHD
jgi:hypothetical protein